MVTVVKWDGRTEDFNSDKLVRTLTRMGAPQTVAEEVVEELAEEVQDGITTKKLYEMAVEALESHQEIVEFRRDMKQGLARIGTGLQFEAYVPLLLEAYGYEVSGNLVLQGACVTHEIDGIAEKDGEVIYLEVKHHSVLERYTPFEVTLSAKAKLDDLRAGCEQGLNDCEFDRVLIVTNTRLTKHAEQYANCVGIEHLGWNTPRGRGIDWYIERKKFYPVTILRSVTTKERNSLYKRGILTLQHLIDATPTETGLEIERVEELTAETRRVFTCCQADS